jgi:hypothetical protein
MPTICFYQTTTVIIYSHTILLKALSPGMTRYFALMSLQIDLNEYSRTTKGLQTWSWFGPSISICRCEAMFV